MKSEPRFVADRMLGRLARWLRLLGYDAAYDRRWSAGEVVALGRSAGRSILTRDTRLAARFRLPAGSWFYVVHDNPMLQLRHVVETMGLAADPGRAFRRCLDCNEPLEAIPPAAAAAVVPAYVAATQRRFTQCPRCDRVFWAGTHRDHALGALQRVLGPRGSGEAGACKGAA